MAGQSEKIVLTKGVGNLKGSAAVSAYKVLWEMREGKSNNSVARVAN